MLGTLAVDRLSPYLDFPRFLITPLSGSGSGSSLALALWLFGYLSRYPVLSVACFWTEPWSLHGRQIRHSCHFKGRLQYHQVHILLLLLGCGVFIFPPPRTHGCTGQFPPLDHTYSRDKRQDRTHINTIPFGVAPSPPTPPRYVHCAYCIQRASLSLRFSCVHTTASEALVVRSHSEGLLEEGTEGT